MGGGDQKREGSEEGGGEWERTRKREIDKRKILRRKKLEAERKREREREREAERERERENGSEIGREWEKECVLKRNSMPTGKCWKVLESAGKWDSKRS